MMVQDRAESNREPIDCGRFINQFLPDIIKLIRQLERINTKICRQVSWYLPTPPLGQDMTQGQFLSGV